MGGEAELLLMYCADWVWGSSLFRPLYDEMFVACLEDASCFYDTNGLIDGRLNVALPFFQSLLFPSALLLAHVHYTPRSRLNIRLLPRLLGWCSRH